MCVEFSAVTGEGVERLREIIEEVAEAGIPSDSLEEDFKEEPQDDRSSDIGSGFLTPRKRNK